MVFTLKVQFTIELVSSKFVLKTNLFPFIETKSTVSCTFKGNTMTADVKVAGDDFAYKMKGKR